MIAYLTLEIRIEGAHSLKDKRQVVRSVKDGLRAHFNVSVAELDPSEAWQRGPPKTACCNERLRGCWKQCSRRIFWNARMDFGLDAILTVPFGHCGRSSSRRRLETCSRRTSGATLTTSSMIGCRDRKST